MTLATSCAPARSASALRVPPPSSFRPAPRRPRPPPRRPARCPPGRPAGRHCRCRDAGSTCATRSATEAPTAASERGSPASAATTQKAGHVTGSTQRRSHENGIGRVFAKFLWIFFNRTGTFLPEERRCKIV